MKKKILVQRAGNIWLLSFIIMMSCSTVFALDPMGLPVVEYKKGQMDAMIEYSCSTMDIKLHDGVWTELFNGFYNGSGDAVSFKLKDFKTNKVYLNCSSGYDNLQIFCRIGGAMARFGDSIWEDSEKFDGNVDLAFGIGLKATFYDNGKLKLGGLIQANWAEYNGELNASHWPEADRVVIDMGVTQIALGAAYKFSDNISIYGGPFWYYVSGSLDDKVTENIAGDTFTTRYSWDIDDSANFGTYFGAKINLNESTSFNIEFQHADESDAFVAGFRWRF